MNIRFPTILVLICIIISNTNKCHSQEIIDSTFGKGIFNVISKDSSWSMKFTARLQFLSSSILDADNTESNTIDQNFSVRRARLKFDGFAFKPNFKYKIELGLSNQDISGGSDFTSNTPRIILDAFIMWNFSPNWELWVGQAKLPGNIERVVSSGDLQFVDRSILNRNYNIDRDLGIQVRHKNKIGDTFIIREKVAISQGEGRNITQGNQGGLQYTGRLEFLPLGEFTSKGDYSSSDLKRESTPKLMISATYDHNNNAVRSRSNIGDFMFLDDGSLFETNINTLFADAIFKYKGFSFQGEYASRSSDNPIALNEDGTETGDVVNVGNSINLQAGYLLPSNIEFSSRYTMIRLDNIAGGTDTSQYTLGVSKYIVGHKLKVQSDLSYTAINGKENNWMFRAQLDVHL